MKTSINHSHKDARQNGYTPDRLSVKDAFIWFVITVVALCIAGTAHAKRPLNSNFNRLAAPVAHNITMSPIVQASAIWPFTASSSSGAISMFTVQTLPQPWQGVLSMNMNGILVPVEEGMMLSADLAASLSFSPELSFTGDATFTYTASDEQGLISNTAIYTIPVLAKPPVSLPITLLHFSGAANSKKVQLYWQTANENNSSYFELQRSADGKNFEAIATVTAKGNAFANDYQSTDDLFFFSYTTVYYRIKMVNINGSFKYSTAVTISLGEIVKSIFKAWPMPFANNLSVAYTSENDGLVKIIIRSINGGEVMNMNNTVKKGMNTISLYQAQNIPSGTYLLTISNGTKGETIKVIKQ